MVNTNVIQNILQGNTNIHNGPKNKNDKKKILIFFLTSDYIFFPKKTVFETTNAHLATLDRSNQTNIGA